MYRRLWTNYLFSKITTLTHRNGYFLLFCTKKIMEGRQPELEIQLDILRVHDVPKCLFWGSDSSDSLQTWYLLAG